MTKLSAVIVGTMRVGLAQGNVEQDRKWDPAFQNETMERYRTLTLGIAAIHWGEK